MSPQVAARIEKVLHIPAHVWLNLQSGYNLDMLRTSELVDGYLPANTPSYALADPGQTEAKEWDIAFRAGQRDMADRISAKLLEKGIPQTEVEQILQAALGQTNARKEAKKGRGNRLKNRINRLKQ